MKHAAPAPSTVPRRALGPLTVLAALLLAALPGCSSGEGGQSGGEPAIPKFDSARAWKHLETLVGFGPRPVGSPGIEKAREYMEQELRSYGLEPRRESFQSETPFGEMTFANVYADLVVTGEDGKPEPFIFLGSHFDTKRLSGRLEDEKFVGANDGGSSTAVLLELARVLTKAPERRYSYRFLFLDGEEALRLDWYGKDNTYGSRYHVTQLKRRGELSMVKMFVLLDLVGDVDLRLTTDLNSDPDLLRTFFDAARELGLGAHVGGPKIEVLDDHLSFITADIPSVDLIDLDFGPNNSYWHTLEDNLSRCSQESLDVIGRITLAGLAKIEAR